MVKYFGNYTGGFISQEYSDYKYLNVSQETIVIIYKTFIKYGNYP